MLVTPISVYLNVISVDNVDCRGKTNPRNISAVVVDNGFFLKLASNNGVINQFYTGTISIQCAKTF